MKNAQRGMRGRYDMEKLDDYDKQLIADLLKKIEIIDTNFSGELTIGFTDGGIKFIRKSEILK